MPTIIISDRSGIASKVDAQPGLSVMEIIRHSGFDELLALCGGNCSCATCHVFIEPNPGHQLPSITADESDLLDSSSHRQLNSRLSCQIRFEANLDGLRVYIAPED